jgi:polyisoprenoid-binding protein YceI
MAKLIRHPKTKRGALLAVAAALALVAVGGFLLVYFVLFPTSSPKAFTLTTQTQGTQAQGTTGGASKSLAARWTIGAGSAAGYRVREKLAFLPAKSDAVGRTSAIRGTASFTGSDSALTVESAAFIADVTKLTSDRSMRDQRIHTIGLQSDQYPKASFTLARAIKLPASAAAGGIVNVSATGALMIHGTSKSVTIPLQMRLSSSKVEVVGSLTFPWAEFNMTAPSIGSIVNVDDEATMEFDLHLRRAS